MANDLSDKECIETLLKTSVKSFTIGDGCKKGDNVAGSLQSIVARTMSGETISAVYKSFPAKDSPMYEHMKEGGIFRRECDAYTVIFKDVENLVNSRRMSNSNSSDTEKKTGQPKNKYVSPLPTLYNHFNDDENDYLCLEDVRPQGFTMPNVFNGLTYPETSLILQELAAFHAYTYALIRLEGEQLLAGNGKWSRFDFTTRKENTAHWFAIIKRCVKNSIEILQNINPPLGQKMLDEIPPEKTVDLMGSFQTLTNTKLFPCIVHGDFWSNNVLIKYDGKSDAGTGNRDRKPIAVKFVDFQFTRYGNIFEDLVYFLFTSTDTAFRGKYLTQVLVDYHGSFKNALESIKFPMPVNFTAGFLIDTFNSLAKAGLAHMCFAIPPQLGQHSEPEPEPKPAAPGPGPELTLTGETERAHANDPKDEDPAATKMAEMLREMIKSSPPALKRLQEVTHEILVSGKY